MFHSKSSISPIIIVMLIVISHQLSNAYTNISSYSYCGGDPINCIDPNGKDIVVLNLGTGLEQHMAMLIQNDEGKWQYYSINGDNVYSSGKHSGGRPFDDIAVGSWDSPIDFLESAYNINHGIEGKTDDTVNNYGFKEGYQIPSTKEQDAIMRDTFTEISKTSYNLLNNNCATGVQEVMLKAGLAISGESQPVYTPMTTTMGLINVVTDFKISVTNQINTIPSTAFKAIMNVNPNGTYYHK